MERVALSFGKDKTAIIKGIAIIFMIMLHCGVGDVFKICVGIFTFMVGYGYAFARNKDWHYSLAHIKKLLIPFWTILFVFTFPVMYIKGNLGGYDMILLNLFGINSEYNFFSWFVAFFTYAMIVLPFMSRLIDKWPVIATVSLIAASWLIEAAVHTAPGWSDNDWTQRLFDCMLCTPGMLLGYLFAHKAWFTVIRLPNHPSMIVLASLCVGLAFLLRNFLGSVAGFNLDFFYAPLFIFAVLIVFNLYKLPIITRVLTALGGVSVYMWFFHALFFTDAVRSVYWPIINISENLWIITIWTVFVTFVCSKCINVVVEKTSCISAKFRKRIDLNKSELI